MHAPRRQHIPYRPERFFSLSPRSMRRLFPSALERGTTMLTVEQRHLLVLEFESAQAAAKGFARGWQSLAEHPLDAAFRLHVEDVEAARGFYELLNSFTDW